MQATIVEKDSIRKSSLSILEFAFILLACIYYSNHEVQHEYGFAMTIASTSYVIFCYVKEPRFRKKILAFLLMLILFSVLYLLLTDSLSISTYVTNRDFKRFFSKYSQYILMFMPLFMFYRTATRASLKQMYIIIGVILVNLVILAQTARDAAARDAEILHTFDAESIEVTGLSKSGFYYVYAYTFLVLTGWICFKYVKKKKIQYISLGFAIFSLILLINAQYALSVITTFISLLYVSVSCSERPSQKMGRFIAVVLILLLSPFLIRGVMSVSSSRIINDRLAEVYDLITGEDTTTGTDGQGRLELYWMCIKAFFSSPIIGNRTLPADGHSTFLTVAADIGIYGVFFLYTFFKQSYKVVAEILGNKIAYFKPLMLQILLMGFTNPIHSSPTIYINLFFMCPLIIMLLIDNNKMSKGLSLSSI